jgi:hypothetical protein
LLSFYSKLVVSFSEVDGRMTDLSRDLDAALAADGPIPREKVLFWIGAAVDLSCLSRLYRLTGEGYYRIQPELGTDETCALIQRYLLECIRQDVTGDEQIETRWEAAGTLHVWFLHLLEMEGTAEVLTNAARAVTQLFLTSGDGVRAAIEQGFLEHALETSALRPYFAHWSSEPRLHEAWSRALEWGEAHPDYIRGLLQRLPRR